MIDQAPPPVIVTHGDSPVILGMPHGGTGLDAETAARLDDNGLALADTDWHIDRLYADLLPGVTTVRATFHRYVIDANRAPSGESLYPGQNTTGLCPLTDFDGRPLYQPGKEPDQAEIARRDAAYHRPYHAALAAEIARVKALHGIAILYDCHSIRSVIPFLFDGTLPDFNIGTDNGKTCASAIEKSVTEIAGSATGFSSIVNGRFRGGWTTRHYGRPPEGVHAIQMELAQKTYMRESPPWDYAPEAADRIRPHLKTILHELDRLGRSGELK